MRTIADMIREARQSKGWTQATLANKAGVGRGTVARVECGRGDASPENLQRLLAVLGFTKDAIDLVSRQACADPRMRQFTNPTPIPQPQSIPVDW
jgi:transcriptional regulator with XRE-family HTH domain